MEWVRQLANDHAQIVERLDGLLQPLVEIRDNRRPAPLDPGQSVMPFLQWTQREFLPYLQEEQDLCRPHLLSSAQGEALYREMLRQHEKLRFLARQAREEIVLLLNEETIREAWWDTLDLSSLWAFRRALAGHIDHEQREVFNQQ